MIGGGTAYGIGYAMRCKQRVKELLELERILQSISGELKFRHAILSEIFGHVMERFGQPFRDWLCCLRDDFSSLDADAAGQIWTSALQMLKENSSLSQNDILMIESLGASLGCSDLEMQLTELSFVTELIRCERQNAARDLANRSKVAVTLSAVGALMLVIILL